MCFRRNSISIAVPSFCIRTDAAGECRCDAVFATVSASGINVVHFREGESRGGEGGESEEQGSVNHG